MKMLTLLELENITAGNGIGNFCKGFGGVAAVYAAGAAYNLWNPVGQGAMTAIVAIGLGCAANDWFS